MPQLRTSASVGRVRRLRHRECVLVVQLVLMMPNDVAVRLLWCEVIVGIVVSCRHSQIVSLRSICALIDCRQKPLNSWPDNGFQPWGRVLVGDECGDWMGKGCEGCRCFRSSDWHGTCVPDSPPQAGELNDLRQSSTL